MTKSHWISDLKWMRAGQQSRSQKTQMALIDAAEHLFAERGLDATSVADIAAQAECSVGSVYHHFRDKTALLHAILHRLNVEIQDTTRQATHPDRWTGAPICAILHGYLEFSLEVVKTRPGLRILELPEVRQDAEARARLIAVKNEALAGMTSLLAARRNEIHHPDPDLAICLVLDTMIALLRHRADPFPYPSRMSQHSDEVFVTEVVHVASAYLGLKTGL